MCECFEKSCFKKRKKTKDGGEDVIVIEDNHGKISCNIFEFLEWCDDVGLMRTRTSRSMIESYANYFIAYQSYVNVFKKEDTPEARKQWYRKYQAQRIEISLGTHLRG